MAIQSQSRFGSRRKRRIRIRKKISGISGRPRMAVFRSSKHIYAQVIDDLTGRTLASMSSIAKGFEGNGDSKKTDIAFKVGKELAEKCKSLDISQVAFDRGGYRYHGRVKAIADGAREGGLSF
ncbi:MAG: 50S ribosomal protein L18 [Myxococcota bacterium]|nr:50S ribosomal protein L18 [Myxococcota bacterium]